MKYKIEFDLPDNETVVTEIKTEPVKWSVWGYSGYAFATPVKGKKSKRQMEADNSVSPEIVRCKDCKHFKDNRCLNDDVHYSIDDCGCQPSFYVTDDWFCANGERRS